MLPSSHSEPIFAGAAALLEYPGAAKILQPVEAELLADAFSEFIAASGRLETSYRDLQADVAQLGLQLADRNRALKQSLEQNRHMRDFLEQILASMPCGVLVVSAGDRIERMNPEAAALLGVDAELTVRLQDISACAGIDMQACSLMDGEQEFALPRTDGQRWIEMRTRRFGGATQDHREQDHPEAQAILILRDITVQKQAEQEREAARRAMALAEIAATLAHEIRNPLAGLEFFGGLIASEAAAQGVSQNRSERPTHVTEAASRIIEWVEHLRAGIRTLSGTVNNVLSFYGTGFAAMAMLPVSATFANAVEFVRPIAAQAGVLVSFRKLEQEAWVRGSDSALGQIILNLMCNAVRHTPRGGSVTVSITAPRDGWIALRCSDTGCGIAAEHLPEIFRPGFSAGGARSGLGLAVCLRIAAEHGGTLTVESVEGSGATFVMEIPRV